MKLEGIIAYPITPFKADGQEVDVDALSITLNTLLELMCAEKTGGFNLVN